MVWILLDGEPFKQPTLVWATGEIGGAGCAHRNRSTHPTTPTLCLAEDRRGRCLSLYSLRKGVTAKELASRSHFFDAQSRVVAIAVSQIAFAKETKR